MKEDVQAAVIEDLKSGRFSQGYGYLRAWNDDEKRWDYCCLGVICERSGLGEWQEFYTEDGEKVSNYLGESQYLPNAVAEWAGIPAGCDDGSVQSRLAELNDEEHSFVEIADSLPTIVAEDAP